MMCVHPRKYRRAVGWEVVEAGAASVRRNRAVSPYLIFTLCRAKPFTYLFFCSASYPQPVPIFNYFPAPSGLIASCQQIQSDSALRKTEENEDEDPDGADIARRTRQ